MRIIPGTSSPVGHETLVISNVADPALLAENIKEGVTIFGVTGTYTGV